jgi:hypothetical protein
MRLHPVFDHALLHVSRGPQLSHCRFALVVHGDTSFAPLQSAQVSQRASAVAVPGTKNWRPVLHVRTECGRHALASAKWFAGHASEHERALSKVPDPVKMPPINAREHGRHAAQSLIEEKYVPVAHAAAGQYRHVRDAFGRG